MFYLKTLTHTVLLHPRFFARNLKDRLKKTLVREVSGSNLGMDGFVVAVCKVQDKDVSRGKLQTATGQAVFHIKFDAILLRPYKNEVVQAEVMLCNRLGLFQVGPMEIFVSGHLMGKDFEGGWTRGQNGKQLQRLTSLWPTACTPILLHCKLWLREGKWTIVGEWIRVI